MDKKLESGKKLARKQARHDAGKETAHHLRTLAYLLPQVLRAMLHGPRTVGFPFEPAEIPEGYRGTIRINAERCRGCSLCVRDCPAFALELEREGRDQFRLIYHPDRCAYCGQCELSCNFGAIYQDKDFTRGTPDRESLVTVLVDRKPEV